MWGDLPVYESLTERASLSLPHLLYNCKTNTKDAKGHENGLA